MLAVGCGEADIELPEKIEFNRHVRPILSNSCLPCHGPDANARQANLRLDVREIAIAERDGIRAIVPGSPGASELFRRVTHPDPAERMPPVDSERKLDDYGRALLERWIAEGAEHWAYVPPSRPEIPEVGRDDWVRQPVDDFVLTKLEERGVSPSIEADRITLARRLSFDLTGLPPTPDDVDAFVADASPDAYEKLVDGLLASPHYGERMAIDWLDQVRFADTNGYHSDEERLVYPYRDYIIARSTRTFPSTR